MQVTVRTGIERLVKVKNMFALDDSLLDSSTLDEYFSAVTLNNGTTLIVFNLCERLSAFSIIFHSIFDVVCRWLLCVWLSVGDEVH